jgi:hypothetical protein
LNIGEYDSDVEVAFKNENGLVGAFCLDCSKAGGFDHIDRVHADEKFVLDDQNDGSLFARMDRKLHL